MHVDHHHNKLEQKKVLNRLLSVEKLAIVFYLLYFVVRWPFHDIISGDLQFKSFSLLLRYEDLWAILLRGLLYNENNEWGPEWPRSEGIIWFRAPLSNVLKSTVQFCVLYFTDLLFHLFKKNNLFNAMEGCLTY